MNIPTAHNPPAIVPLEWMHASFAFDWFNQYTYSTLIFNPIIFFHQFFCEEYIFNVGYIFSLILLSIKDASLHWSHSCIWLVQLCSFVCLFFCSGGFLFYFFLGEGGRGDRQLFLLHRELSQLACACKENHLGMVLVPIVCLMLKKIREKISNVKYVLLIKKWQKKGWDWKSTYRYVCFLNQSNARTHAPIPTHIHTCYMPTPTHAAHTKQIRVELAITPLRVIDQWNLIATYGTSTYHCTASKGTTGTNVSLRCFLFFSACPPPSTHWQLLWVLVRINAKRNLIVPNISII